MDKKVSIILSTYNEALEIKETINKISEFIPNAEIILVDDNSTDGTLEKAKIDWGYAKDYVETSWQIMQLKKPDFFVVATGEVHSVEYFVKNCFSYVNLDYKKYLKIDKKLLRPSKTSILKGDITKARKIFKYKPKTKLKDLIKIMMDHELKKYNG